MHMSAHPQRLLRRKDFSTAASRVTTAIKLTPIDALLGLARPIDSDDDDDDDDDDRADSGGQSRRKDGPSVTVLGMLSVLQEVRGCAACV